MRPAKAASKTLGVYRERVRLGIATDTQSTRRRFAARMEALGAHPVALQRYVGHKPLDMTHGTYAGSAPTASLAPWWRLRRVAKGIN